MADTLAALSALGLQLVRMDDIGRRLVLIRDKGLVVADSDLSLEYVAMAARAMSLQTPQESLSA